MQTKAIYLLVFMVIIASGCKNSTPTAPTPAPAVQYDIRGTWSLDCTWKEGSVTWNLKGSTTFSGSLSSGTWTWGQDSGNYEVNGANVHWSGSNQDFTGKFSSQNNMSGNFTRGGNSGTWTASR